jgi:hypothetical protein
MGKIKNWVNSSKYKYCKSAKKRLQGYNSDLDYYTNTTVGSEFVFGLIARKNESTWKVLYSILDIITIGGLPKAISSSYLLVKDKSLNHKDMVTVANRLKTLRKSNSDPKIGFLISALLNMMQMRNKGAITFQGYAVVHSIRDYLRASGDLNPDQTIMNVVRDNLSFEEWEAGI